MIILLLWVWNFAISILNAWICGKTWNESKHAGGLPRFMNWCGAVMSASGFTWCYLLVIGFFGATIPIIKNEEGVRETLLTVEQLHVFMDLGYLVVIFPILGSGLAITVHAWGVFWRRRRITDGAVAAYDTFAMIYNISSALRHVPRAGQGQGPRPAARHPRRRWRHPDDPLDHPVDREGHGRQPGPILPQPVPRHLRREAQGQGRFPLDRPTP
jgi:hypothetical protein